ncbi:hypothetical protein [Asticcacaulis solisilvae]|uniref:hypothetical protein n=1 Tax=Asticcacaulis solisilvae TaxID=1217274 RepID=UPI003FD72F6F
MVEILNRAVKALVDEMQPILEGRGFKIRKGIDVSFSKRERFGFLYLSLPSFPMPENGGYQVVNCGLGVRHNRVDEIVNQLGHIWGDANCKNTTTVYRGLQFFPFVAARDEKQIIRFPHVEVDATVAAENIRAMLEADGFEFFERYSSLGECAQGLNEPIETRVHPLCNGFPLRAYYGVAAAALTEPDRVPHLIEQYIEFIRDSGIVDPLMYEVAKDKSGLAAVAERLEFVARLGIASGLQPSA